MDGNLKKKIELKKLTEDIRKSLYSKKEQFFLKSQSHNTEAKESGHCHKVNTENELLFLVFFLKEMSKLYWRW